MSALAAAMWTPTRGTVGATLGDRHRRIVDYLAGDQTTKYVRQESLLESSVISLNKILQLSSCALAWFRPRVFLIN
jgi:hypothetical protein